MTDYAFASAKELVAAIKNKEISSLELTDLYIERIEKFDGEINAVVVHDFERGREAAIASI
jgi:amidase